MADEDIPPPLEDMTDVINRISAIKAKVDQKSSEPSLPQQKNSQTVTQAGAYSKSANNSLTVKPKQISPNVSSNSTGKCGFAGMKKGFLSCGLDIKKPQGGSGKPVENSKSNDTSIPHIKADPSKTNSHLVMQEVQKMREQLQKTDAWLTEDLLNKLGNNEKLMSMMADPRCERALQEFQTNPDKALVTYQHDKYIQEFFREFCDVLGNHYENLNEASLDVAGKIVPGSADQKAPPTTERKEELIKEVKSTRKQTAPKSVSQIKKEEEEDARVRQVLSNPQLVEILQSENIMQLIKSLKENPEQAQRLLQQGGKEFQEKVRVLVDAGLLAFER